MSQGQRRSHVAPFLEGPRAWLVLARNAIPVVGVYALDWPAAIVVIQIWFDGVTALGAMLALQMRAFLRNDSKPFPVPGDFPPHVLPAILFVVWLLLLALIGIPYWFTLFFFSFAVFRDGFWSVLFGSPELIATLLLVLISNSVEEFRRGYERMSDIEIRREFNWDFSMHLARISVMLLAAFWLSKHIVVGLALALSYVEIYPMRTLRFLGGDRTLEAGNENRSRD